MASAEKQVSYEALLQRIINLTWWRPERPQA